MIVCRRCPRATGEHFRTPHGSLQNVSIIDQAAKCRAEFAERPEAQRVNLVGRHSRVLIALISNPRLFVAVTKVVAGGRQCCRRTLR